MTDTTSSPRTYLLHSAWGPILWALLFLAAFLIVFYVQPTTDLVINNSTIKSVFDTYAVAAGPVLALIACIAMYLLAGIKRIAGLRRFLVLNPFVVLIVMAPLAAFGWELLYKEQPYTDIARAVIGVLATPLWYASLLTCGLAIVWLIVLLLRRR